MPRSDPTINLTDARRRDRVCPDPGRPLPERYRFILFKEKRQVELVCSHTMTLVPENVG
jgi:hypothetical protein